MSRGQSNAAPQRGLRVRPRDLAVLGEIGLVGVLDAATIRARHFPDDRTGEACRRRLRLYADHGLTQAVRLHLAVTQRVGRLPDVHRLTTSGAALVEEETGARPPRFARNNRPPAPHTLLHRLGVSKLMLMVNDACAARRLVVPSWILEYDMAPNAPLKASLSQRFLLRFDFTDQDGATHVCWPDAACLFAMPLGGQMKRLAVVWEYDRGTETHEQIVDKLAGLDRFHARERWQGLFPAADAVRTFFVVPSDGRAENLLGLVRNTQAASVTRVAVESALTARTMLSAPVWLTPQSRRTPGGWTGAVAVLPE